jgi:hypothetical protein
VKPAQGLAHNVMPKVKPQSLSSSDSLERMTSFLEIECEKKWACRSSVSSRSASVNTNARNRMLPTSHRTAVRRILCRGARRDDMSTVTKAHLGVGDNKAESGTQCKVVSGSSVGGSMWSSLGERWRKTECHTRSEYMVSITVTTFQ